MKKVVSFQAGDSNLNNTTWAKPFSAHALNVVKNIYEKYISLLNMKICYQYFQYLQWTLQLSLTGDKKLLYTLADSSAAHEITALTSFFFLTYVKNMWKGAHIIQYHIAFFVIILVPFFRDFMFNCLDC